MLLTDEAIAHATGAAAGGLLREATAGGGVSQGAEDGTGHRKATVQSQAGLQPTIALLSVLAVALVNVREARDAEKAERPATDYVDAL